MEKEKVLEIEFKQVWDKWAWRFIKNDTTEIEYHSTDKTNILSIINGILFAIIGDNKKNINEFDMLNDYSKTKLEEFVNEINEKYGTQKRWRAGVGNHQYSYFFINSLSEIDCFADNATDIDEKRYYIGNYFKTQEEAKKVKEKLYKFWAKVRAGEIG